MVHNEAKHRPPPPDLQALVAAHGSYSAIPPEAWAKYDRDCERYRERMGSGEHWGYVQATPARRP